MVASSVAAMSAYWAARTGSEARGEKSNSLWPTHRTMRTPEEREQLEQRKLLMERKRCYGEKYTRTAVMLRALKGIQPIGQVSAEHGVGVLVLRVSQDTEYHELPAGYPGGGIGRAVMFKMTGMVNGRGASITYPWEKSVGRIERNLIVMFLMRSAMEWTLPVGLPDQYMNWDLDELLAALFMLRAYFEEITACEVEIPEADTVPVGAIS